MLGAEERDDSSAEATWGGGSEMWDGSGRIIVGQLKQ